MQVKLDLENNKTFKVSEVTQLFKKERPNTFNIMAYLAKNVINSSCNLITQNQLIFHQAPKDPLMHIR